MFSLFVITSGEEVFDLVVSTCVDNFSLYLYIILNRNLPHFSPLCTAPNFFMNTRVKFGRANEHNFFYNQLNFQQFHGSKWYNRDNMFNA